MIEVEYKVPSNGLGTDFSESERPLTFAGVYTNRFRNVAGGAERRPGVLRWNQAIVGMPNLTRLHEFISTTGVDILFASDDNGNIWRSNVSATTSASNWTQVVTGKSPSRFISAEADGKLIFVNGVDRNFYTSDGENFQELKALITVGTMAAGTSAGILVDGTIPDWINDTLVAQNDLVYNTTLNAYGLVSTIVSAQLSMTIIGSAATGAGIASRDQTDGDNYEIIDYVDSNIIPGANNTTGNFATATSGTTTTVIAVSGVNFSTTQIRLADIIYNTTRAAIAFVGSVSANVNITQPITGQVPGDAIVFFKSAMPITSWVHVHYGRTYYLDQRDQQSIVISGPDDPEDLTTFQQTLNATSFSFGSQQSTGDIILSMATFQSYFVASGLRNLYIYQGITPIQDTEQTVINFNPISFYPNGIASRFGLNTNGVDLLHVTTEGLQAITIVTFSNTTVQNNASVPIRTAILQAILAASADNIQLSYYPRRSWQIVKVADQCWILNTNPQYDNTGKLTQGNSWHLFNGPWAQMNHYFVRRSGDLLACGANGQVWEMDSGAATDDGTSITTDLTFPWVRLEENIPPGIKTIRIKAGQYINPLFESGPDLGYTINAVAGFDGYSTDSVQVSAAGEGQIGSFVIGQTAIGSGSYAQRVKTPLRWRGSEARIQFTSNSSAAPDVITGFSLYGEILGMK